MRSTDTIAVSCLVALVAIGIPAAEAAVEADAVFAQLKSLEGTWEGSARGKETADGEEVDHEGTVVHEFRVSAAGTVVMETMMPGTDHEMINMYHLDGDDLVLTHYCAGGNQPRMRLDREASTPDTLIFDFAGGTNLDPKVDHHIHAAKIRMAEDGAMKSVWKGWSDGEPAGVMNFHLTRAE